MAIDADLSAGLIDEKDARRRRKTLEDESGFFGAMDGASKFVRGDAIAGLLVVLINFIGGMVIGIMQQGLTFAEAAHAYTLLSVGDGLVTQVPALIVSIAAGLLVSKAGVAGAADKALLSQFSGYPKALGMSAAVMLVMALLPGIPMIPFLAMGGGTASLAYVIDRRHKLARATETREGESRRGDAQNRRSQDRAKLRAVAACRRHRRRRPPYRADQGAAPLARIRDGFRHAGGAHPRQRSTRRQQLRHQDQEVECGTGKVWHGQYMVMDPAGKQVALLGMHTTEPTFGLPATWIDGSLKEEASVRGYTVVDAATVLATHLTELIKANMSELLSYGEVQKLIKELPKEQGELMKDIVPAHVTISGIQRVLQILLAERVSIRDLATILEGIADGLAATRNPAMLAEHVRALGSRLPADHRAYRQVGAGLCRIDCRPRRRAQPRHAAAQADGVHQSSPRKIRAGSARRRSAGAGDFARHQAVRARHRRTLPRANQRAGADRNSPAGAAKDRRQHLGRFALCSAWRHHHREMPVFPAIRGLQRGTARIFTLITVNSRFSEVRFKSDRRHVPMKSDELV